MVCRVAPLELIRLLSDSVMSLQVAKDDSCVNHNNNRINNAVLLLLPLSTIIKFYKLLTGLETWET